MQITNNFNLSEFTCNKLGKFNLQPEPVPKELIPNCIELAKNLQIIRNEINEPITINSGYRSPQYNELIGGAKNSQHLQCKAADLKTKMKPSDLRDVIFELMNESNIMEGGLKAYNSFVHYDIRGIYKTW